MIGLAWRRYSIVVNNADVLFLLYRHIGRVIGGRAVLDVFCGLWAGGTRRLHVYLQKACPETFLDLYRNSSPRISRDAGAGRSRGRIIKPCGEDTIEKRLAMAVENTR
jgi:hypothetical protein